jgi:predicted transcriptional regulator
MSNNIIISLSRNHPIQYPSTAMETSLLIQFIGDNPSTRIMDFLISNKGMDYSKKDMAEGAGISRAALFKHWKNVEEFGIAKETRRFGKTKLYTLNTKNEVVQKLLTLESTLIKQAMETARQKSLDDKHKTGYPLKA